MNALFLLVPTVVVGSAMVVITTDMAKQKKRQEAAKRQMEYEKSIGYEHDPFNKRFAPPPRAPQPKAEPKKSNVFK